MNWQPIRLSLELAASVAAILLVIAMPIAYWIAFSRQRWKFLVESVVALPLVLPPTVLGFYFLVAAGPNTAFGRWYQSLTGHTLAFTFSGLVAASVLYSLPFAVQPMANAFGSVDRRLLEAASILGASRWRAFRTVVLPLSLAGVVSGVVLSFAHTLGEFGVVLMVGGNIPGVTQTASIAIYDDVQAFSYRSANSTAIVLLVLAFVLLSLTYGLNRRSASWMTR